MIGFDAGRQSDLDALSSSSSSALSEAGKYDKTVKSKWFSQNIESDVSTLSAQTDVQHCVSTLVVNCTKSGWAMWRFLLDHSGTEQNRGGRLL